MALIDRPIIIIGAGRSGTSLLDAVLGAHPEIAMFGEFGGTIDQLWRQFWQVSSAGTQRTRRIMAERARCPEPDGASEAEIFSRVRDIERQERLRVAQIIRHALDALYTVGELPGRYWGFKEIYAGTADPPDWQPADLVFPEALYLHIVRHPYDYARSAADWRRLPFTAAQLRSDLADWLRYLRLNGARADTGRYFRLTYEALLADPAAALAPVLARLGLGWEEECRAAFGRRYVPSSLDSPLPAGILASGEAVPGLAEAMAEFGYALPEEPAAQSDARPDRPAVSPLGPGKWQLNPPFLADQGEAWTARLHLAPDLAGFEAQADNLEHPYRSPLIVQEDGVALGPPHSLHASIRESGKGRFSHWGPQQILLFSASDNSDPNRNGRRYTISV